MKTRVEYWRENLSYLLARPHGRKSEVARAADINKVHLSNLLAGKRSPTLGTAIAISEATGVSIADMLMPPTMFRQAYQHDGPVKRRRPRTAAGAKKAEAAKAKRATKQKQTA